MKVLSSATKLRIPLVVLVVLALVGVAMALSSGFAVAGNDVKLVRGYVRDSAARPLNGAVVVLEIRTPLNALRFTDTFTTGSDGFYSFTLVAAEGEWLDGDTIKLIVTYSGNQKTVTAADDGNPIQLIDVTFPFEIPQFGSILGFGIAACAVGLVAMVFVVKRKKN